MRLRFVALLTFLTVALAGALWPALVAAHANLDRSEPVARSAVPVAPTEILLYFTEPPELRYSEIVVYDVNLQHHEQGALRAIPGDELGMAIDVFNSLNVTWDKNKPLLIGIAKGADRKAGLETLFFVPEGEGISLPPDSPALHVIQHIRDDSHNHAITGHRQRRAKVRNTSALELIEGVGPKRRQVLLKYMGGLQPLLNASVEEIAKVPGISQALAEKIYNALKH